MAKQWDLTQEQRTLAELLALGNPETSESLTVVDACRLNNTSRSTYYHWIHNNEDFTEYMNYVADRAAMARIAKYDQRLDHLIMNSDNENVVVKAISEIYKRTGKFKSDTQVDVNVNDNRSIADVSDDELERRVREKMEQRQQNKKSESSE